MNKNNRLIVIGMNVLALLMLLSVITSHFFYLPYSGDTGQITMIVMAGALTSLSTWYAVGKNKEKSQ